MIKPLLVAAFLAGAAAVSAQAPFTNSDSGNLTRFSQSVRAGYDEIKRDIVAGAEAVPESEYGFKPTPDVRSFGEIIGHVADAQNYSCAMANGANPQWADPIEKTVRSKAELVKRLKDSVAACDAVIAKTDAGNV